MTMALNLGADIASYIQTIYEDAMLLLDVGVFPMFRCSVYYIKFITMMSRSMSIARALGRSLDVRIVQDLEEFASGRDYHLNPTYHFQEFKMRVSKDWSIIWIGKKEVIKRGGG